MRSSIYMYYPHAKRNKTSYIFAECIFNFTKKGNKSRCIMVFAPNVSLACKNRSLQKTEVFIFEIYFLLQKRMCREDLMLHLTLFNCVSFCKDFLMVHDFGTN